MSAGGESQRRAAVGAAALAALVALVAGCAARTGDGTAQPAGAPSDAPSPFGAVPWVEPKPGECPQGSRVFDPSATPPLADFEQQQAVAERVEGFRGEGFAARYVRLTALGVVVLVEGDQREARQRLSAEGVALVAGYGDQDDLEGGIDPEHEVALVVSDQLQPLGAEVRRRIRGLAGSGGLATWTNAGAVLVQWKPPVPAEVRALRDIRTESGARVIVAEVRYSDRELMRAQEVISQLPRAEEITEVSRCGDNSGLLVGVRPEALGDTTAERRSRYADLAGVPVTVIPHEALGHLD
jgi:hypothetical protein